MSESEYQCAKCEMCFSSVEPFRAHRYSVHGDWLLPDPDPLSRSFVSDGAGGTIEVDSCKATVEPDDAIEEAVGREDPSKARFYATQDDVDWKARALSLEAALSRILVEAIDVLHPTPRAHDATGRSVTNTHTDIERIDRETASGVKRVLESLHGPGWRSEDDPKSP